MTTCRFCRTDPNEGETVCKSIGEAHGCAWFTASDRAALVKNVDRTRFDLATENISFRLALEAIADGEGEAQEIARQTLSATQSRIYQKATYAREQE